MNRDMKVAGLGLALTTVFVMGGIASAGAVGAESSQVDALKQEVATLQAKVQDLEKKLAENKSSGAVEPAVQAYDSSDPFAEMEAMQERMNSLMAGRFGMGAGPGIAGVAGRGSRFSFNPDYDIKATDKAYVVTFDMPGMDKSKINVEVKDNVLHVSGERSSENKESDGNRVYRQERSFGYFSQAIPLPQDARAESVEAKYDNGVLTVTVGKKASALKPNGAQKVEVK